MQIRDQLIVITGGASGIGAAMARRFAREGARMLVLVDQSAGPVHALAAELGPGRCEAAVFDVGDGAATRHFIEDTEARLGPIDLYCSNAGITAKGGAELADAVWRSVMDVNLMAHVNAARILVPRMLARGGGYLLHTASAAGLLSQFDAPYAVSKHAAVAFAEWLAIQHGGENGIGVSCLCPAGVDTPLFRTEPEDRQKLMGEGMATPDEVAEAVVQGLAEERFLILPQPFVHDQVLRKAQDPERWIRGMRRWQAQLGENQAPPPR